MAKAGSTEHHCRESSMTLSKELIGEDEDETGEADTKFIGFDYLEENLALKLKG